MKFAQRLREQRNIRGWNQAYLAKYMQVSQVSISNWERGVKEPGFQALIDLANLFGKSTDYMLGVNDEDKSAVKQPSSFERNRERL